MVQISAAAHPNEKKIELNISDGRGGSAAVALDLYQVVHLMSAINIALRDIPRDQTTELADEIPVARATPDFQLALSDEGDIVVILKAHPLPTFHYVFDDDSASAIANSLLKLLRLPKSDRVRPGALQ